MEESKRPANITCIRWAVDEILKEYEEKIEALVKARESAEAACCKLAEMVLELPRSWNGEESEKYVDRFRELDEVIAMKNTTIEVYIRELEAAVTIYEEVTDISNMWSGVTEAIPFNG